ncbi:hypothetical protein K438DRAFT_1766658 [Mycena galopus ATCC 62051]|nr:hypothetical protein K438DRAFT_1766658 [Mycena galopus ATCC 62051]
MRCLQCGVDIAIGGNSQASMGFDAETVIQEFNQHICGCIIVEFRRYRTPMPEGSGPRVFKCRRRSAHHSTEVNRENQKPTACQGCRAERRDGANGRSRWINAQAEIFDARLPMWETRRQEQIESRNNHAKPHSVIPNSDSQEFILRGDLEHGGNQSESLRGI